MRIILVLLVPTFFLVAGCTTISGTNARPVTASLKLDQVRAAERRVGDPTETDADRQAIKSDIDDLLTYCKPILSQFEDETHTQAKNAFYLSIAGMIAGAVIAPALTAAAAHANAAWIAGLSGFSGATNTASIALKTSGLSGTTAAEDRKAIIDRLRTQLAKAFDGTLTIVQRRDAIIAARVECAIYDISVPSIPDASAK